MDDLRLYCKLVRMSIASQMQYRASFAMTTAGLALITVIEFFAVWVLFDRFGSLRGWSLPEVALFYGTIHASFAIGEALGRGFDIFHRLVLRGGFDRLLLRPRSTALQVLGSDLQLLRIGRLAQALVILVWALNTLQLEWTVARAFALLSAIAGGVTLFLGILILQATFSFWSVQGLEFMNAFTHGGVQMAQYPISIYERWFRNFFIYVIPLGCVNYFPIVMVTGREDPLGSALITQLLSPIAGIIFLRVSLAIWEFGTRRYQSTGS